MYSMFSPSEENTFIVFDMDILLILRTLQISPRKKKQERKVYSPDYIFYRPF